jgi:hypothetical protein
MYLGMSGARPEASKNRKTWGKQESQYPVSLTPPNNTRSFEMFETLLKAGADLETECEGQYERDTDRHDM